jgi:hypothetical protein
MNETRFMGDLLGSYVLASRALQTEGPMLLACRARSISSREAVLCAPVAGSLGERLSLSFQELGKLRAVVSRRFESGFAAELDLDEAEREALDTRIQWLKRRSLRSVVERRAHKRVLPRDPNALLLLGQGLKLECLILDMSRSGVAVSADIILKPGTLVAVGSVPGRVMRAFDTGFALQFTELQDLEALEGRLTLRTDSHRHNAARQLGLVGSDH